MDKKDTIKKSVAAYAADLVKQEMTFGLGSGTTVQWLIIELGTRVKQGLHITIVPTSAKTASLALEAGIRISDLNSIDLLSLTIDGADEIDRVGQMIKGGGGALLQEKMVAAASEELVIIADYSKQVDRLGKFPLPVEVIPFGYRQVEKQIMHSTNCKEIKLRLHDGQPFVSDHGHYILDCAFDSIADPVSLNSQLHNIPGLVETGLFIDMADMAIIGREDGGIDKISFRPSV